jgi:hypothetical protein
LASGSTTGEADMRWHGRATKQLLNVTAVFESDALEDRANRMIERVI